MRGKANLKTTSKPATTSKPVFHAEKYRHWIGTNMPFKHKVYYAPHQSLIDKFDYEYYNIMNKVGPIIESFKNEPIDINIAARIVYAGSTSLTESELKTVQDKLKEPYLIEALDVLHKELSISHEKIANDYISANNSAPNIEVTTNIIQRDTMKFATRGYQLENEEEMVIKITMSNIVKYNNHVGPDPHLLQLKFIKQAEEAKNKTPEELSQESAKRKRSMEQLMKDLENAPNDYVRVATEIEQAAKALIDSFVQHIDAGTAYEFISEDIEEAHNLIKTSYERVCRHDFLDALEPVKKDLGALLELVEEVIAENEADRRFNPV